MDLLDVFVRAGQSVSRWPEIQEFVDVGVFVDITVAIVVVLVVFGVWKCLMSLYGRGSQCLQSVPKNALSECCWSHSSPA